MTEQGSGGREEQREDWRVSSRATVFLELAAPDPVTGEAAKILVCQLLDVSAGGMRIRLDRALAAGSILNLCARFASGKTLRVVGEVRWVRPESSFYIAGFSLFESAESDIVDWKLLVADRL